MADPVITPKRALALLAELADGWEILEVDGDVGQTITPARRLALLGMMADCQGILEAARVAADKAVPAPTSGGSALAPER